MDVLQTEMWHMGASGMVEEFLAHLVAITPKDTRGVLETKGSLRGWFQTRAAVTLLYAPSDEAVIACMNFVDNIRYSPALSDLYVKPQNAAVQGGTTLVADAPPEPFQHYLYRWVNYREFQPVGLLSEHNQPGAGIYVIVPESQTRKGMPSLFLTTIA